MRYLAWVLCCLLTPLTANATDLLFSSFVKPTRVVVYELPPGDASAEALKFVKLAGEKIYSAAEFVDATKTDEADLRAKLSGGFVLFSVFGEHSRLFQLVTQPAGLEVKADTVAWQGISTPRTEARIALVGKNPYGGGHVLAMGAGSVKLFLSMFGSGIDWQNRSLMLYQGQSLLARATYDERFAIHDRDNIALPDALADARQMFSTMEAVHPDIAACLGEAAYRKLREQTLQ